MIRFFNRNQIDIERWNSVITASGFAAAYPYSWYLDACADSWGGLIFQDYECVMPIVFRKKMGLKYIYHPRFCQQLGIYSAQRIDPEISRIFLHKTKEMFSIGDYAFNAGNLLGEEKGFDVVDNNNYILDLNKVYEDIYNNYSHNCKRNLKKAHLSDLKFTDRISIEEIVKFKQSGDQLDHNQAHYDFLITMFTKLKEENKLKTFGARNGSSLEVGAIFVYSAHRVLYLLSSSSEKGKSQSGMFLVIDTFIQRHSEEKLFLDFEGSNIPSISRFFRGFGAKPEIYQRVSFNTMQNRILKILRNV